MAQHALDALQNFESGAPNLGWTESDVTEACEVLADAVEETGDLDTARELRECVDTRRTDVLESLLVGLTLSVGDRVAAGHTEQDADCGEITEIDGTSTWVSWDSGMHTRQSITLLRPE